MRSMSSVLRIAAAPSDPAQTIIAARPGTHGNIATRAGEPGAARGPLLIDDDESIDELIRRHTDNLAEPLGQPNRDAPRVRQRRRWNAELGIFSIWHVELH